MENSTKSLERINRREKRNKQYRKSAGTISDDRLISCYVASAVIVGLCIYEMISGKDEILGGTATYGILAALAVVFSVVITLRNREAKRASAGKKKK